MEEIHFHLNASPYFFFAMTHQSFDFCFETVNDEESLFVHINPYCYQAMLLL